MSFHKIWVYTKLTLIGLVVVIVLMFMFSNFHTVTVKFLWWEIYKVPLIAFIFIIGNAGIIVFLVVKRLRKVIADIKAMRAEREVRHRLDKAPKSAAGSAETDSQADKSS